MNWRFWQKKSPPKNPRVSFEMLPNNRVSVSCDWPDAETTDEGVRTAIGMGSMLHFINDGQLLPLMQQAVVLAGQAKGERTASEHVLRVLGTLQARSRGEKDEGGPLVSPDKVFSRD